jgi:hypothetical protein
MPLYVRTTVAVAALLAALSAVGQGLAQPWHEDFEGQQSSWREAGSDTQHRIIGHQRIQGDAHAGRSSEWIRLQADVGTYLYLAHDVGRPAIIDELAPSVWVKSDRPGIQIAVRIVLPRTNDPRTGQPLSTVINGTVYNDVGRWQQLQLADLPRLLTRQVHVLRMQYGPKVDQHEAYVDAVLLNVYNGPGTTNLWIDDLEVAGYVPRQNVQPLSVQPAANLTPVDPRGDRPDFRTNENGTVPFGPRDQAPPGDSRSEPPTTPVRLPSVQQVVSAPRHTVRLVQSILVVDDRPMLPRVIRHRGEPLEFLKQVGFNVVWLDRLPSPEILAEADRLGLWLICPPPRPEGAATSLPEFGPQYDGVLVWDLGDNLIEADLEPTARWADQVHAADHRCDRPLICRPRTDLRGFSRSANLLLIDRRPLGTSLEMSDYARWVRQQPLLASLGTPIWTTVQTQPNEALQQQLAGLEQGYAPPAVVSPDQMRLLAYTAVASGSRGLVFLSDSPLDLSDPDTRQRALTLELLNLELERIEPWAAAGTFVAEARSNFKEVSGAVLRTEHARMLMPLWFSRGAQCVPSQSAANAVTLVAPGVPEPFRAYELTPRGAQPLRRQRVDGGLSVTLDEFGLTSQILLANEPSVVGAVDRRATQIGRRIAELERSLAWHKFNTVQAVAGRLESRTRVAQAASWFNTARTDLQSCDAQLAANNAAGAARSAQRATRSLRLIERAYWDAAISKLVSPVTSPAAASFDTLPCHWRFYDRLRAGQRGPNLLVGGDFEDVKAMMQARWQHVLNPSPTVQTSVQLVQEAAHSGRLGVQLVVAPADPKNPPAAIEDPPIIFMSPPVQVQAGQIVCIHGWVQVRTDITASTDGLLIVDSLAGEALADRVHVEKSKEWRQFALYRVATRPGPLNVTFAMSGIGEAWLDDVAIEVLDQPAAMAQR